MCRLNGGSLLDSSAETSYIHNTDQQYHRLIKKLVTCKSTKSSPSFLFVFFSVVCLVFSLLQLCSLTCTTLVHKCSFMFSIWFQIMSLYWHSGTFSLKTDVNNMSWEYWKVTKSIKPVAAAYAYLGIAFLGARFFKIHCYSNIDYSHNKVWFLKKEWIIKVKCLCPVIYNDNNFWISTPHLVHWIHSSWIHKPFRAFSFCKHFDAVAAVHL